MDSESPTSQAGVPLLHADDGVRIERLSSVLPYQPGMALQTGDVIETTRGFAVIDFDDDNYVALRENTRIQLGSIRLFLGEVFAHISQILERGGGQVITDEMSASVTGTEYSVRRAPLASRSNVDNTVVIVRKGTVRCEGGRWPDRVVQRLLVRRGSGTPPSFGITVPVGPPPRGSRPGPSAPPSRPQTGDQPGTSSTSPAGKTYQGTQGR
jgi:hypothetical protein